MKTNKERLVSLIMKAVKAKIRAGDGKIVTLIHDTHKGEKPSEYVDVLDIVEEELMESKIRFSYRLGYDSIFIIISNLSTDIKL